MKRKEQIELELLAPAKDLECGIAAIDHGADAVYIGGPGFSAREAAGNRLEDILKLIETAHQFHVRVYIALNTILSDDELAAAVDMIHRLYDMGADAIILQDMGLLECDLPPIALHASTQMNNRTKEKVQFLEQLGFQQVVLARELSLTQIREIAKNSTVTLECFVHGALCVSYSGQCYISEVMAGRSANRGLCAQFCRHRFTLKDARGENIVENKHLLSLKDLNQSSNIPAMIEAGIRSFKIEGRLKDSSYVKNVTALYRREIDAVIAGDTRLRRSSSGRAVVKFTPDAAKTFHRGQTEYFLYENRARPGAIDTPKSTGEPIGKVTSVSRGYIEIEAAAALSNGDGLCYFDNTGELIGFRLNRVDKKRLFPAKIVSPALGTMIYRNYDRKFYQQLRVSSGCRKIDISVRVFESDDGVSLVVRDEDGIESSCAIAFEKQAAQKPELTLPAIERRVRQSGDTIFQVTAVETDVSPAIYYPPAVVKELRRKALENHRKKRLSSYRTVKRELPGITPKWSGSSISYLDNVANAKAKEFYLKHGAELSDDMSPHDLMTCKYCIKAQLNLCPQQNVKIEGKYKEPFTLQDNVGHYKLLFNCQKCEMVVQKIQEPSS